MDNSETKVSSGGESSQCVRVAVNVRPLISLELDIGCTDCITVVPGEPQVQIGSHAFTFDYVYGGLGSPYSIYNDCVAPLVDALFHGYNATVLAYGQTGSGKTYTMGTNYNGEENCGGIIPEVMGTIFSRVEAMKNTAEFLIRVSFVEIFKEEVFELLDPNQSAFSRGEGAWVGKPTIPARVPIQIRETVNGGITLAGVTEAEVRSKEEMASYLSRGFLSRATGSTNMNSQLSRSHAIFTISMEQKKVSQHGVSSDDVGDDILCAKLHLVDLAGSERAKRTGADGMRLKEGIHINKGLLALGNVISALGDEKKRKEGGHVPYRDSKLTRLLQDSLGGNSKTVMIACVSPADTNAEETLNTLKYANRARNIQNKAVINRDPMVTQMHKMRSQIEQLQAELFFRSDSNAPFKELQILKHKVSLLEASNSELQRVLQTTCEQLTQRAVDAQVEKDKFILKIESARHGKSWDEINNNSDQKCELLKTYVMKIQQLEVELLRLQNLSSCKVSGAVDCLDSDNEGPHSENAYFTSLREFSCDTNRVEISGEIEKELEHTSLQEKLDSELKELDKKLEEKEAEMKRFANVDTSVLKQHYERKVNELEQEKRSLQKEIGQLRHNLANLSSSSDDGAQKLKEDYLHKLNGLEAQVAELKKKQDAQAQLLRQKQKSDEATKRLQDEIQRIKAQKIQLQHNIKQESEQFRLWKASREKEVLQKSTSNNSSMEGATHSLDLSTHSWVAEQNIGGHKYLLRNNKGPRSSMMLIEDMDTSESEHSDMEASTDDDWSKACCSCSKWSRCMTNQCKCHAVGGICGNSCGCVPAKCSNREAVSIREPDELPQPKMADETVNGLSTSENDESLILASHGAMLLHSAFADKSAVANDDGGPRRKPLSDIGNTQVKSNAPKPNPRKKRKKISDSAHPSGTTFLAASQRTQKPQRNQRKVQSRQTFL